VTGEQPLWRRQVGRRPLLLAAGAVVGAAALPATPAQASPRSRVAAATTDAITGGSWLAGDTHVHCDHSSDGSFIRQGTSQQGPGNVSVADQIGEGERMGLDWMPLTDHRTYDQHWDPQWTSSAMLLVPGEEANGSPHATCIGAVDVVVDGANPAASPSHRHVQQSIWEAHAQDASWGIAHPADVPAHVENDAVVGADTIETWNRASAMDAEVVFAEGRWNKGFRTGVAGACDCHFREVWGVAGPGMPTTWVLASAQTERAVVDALRAGRTTLSFTPLGAFVTLEADTDGDGVFEAVGGDELVVPAGHPVVLRIRVQRAPGMKLLVYEAPGRAAVPILDVTVAGVDETHTLSLTMPPRPTWWRAEIRQVGPPSGVSTAPAEDVPKQPDQLQAMTSPFFAAPDALATPEPAIPLPPLDGLAAGAVVLGGGWHGFPDVAVGSDGPHVVAEVHTPGETGVVHRSPSGTTTALAHGGARMPKVAVSGRSVWVVWQDERQQLPRNPQVYLAHSTDGGATFGPPTRLSDGRGRQERPAIALLADGRPVVAWQAATGSAIEVLAWIQGDSAPAVLSAQGKTITPPDPVDSRSARYPASLFPDIAVLADAVVVSWQDDRNDPNPLWTGTMPPPGSAAAKGTDPDAWEPMVAVRRLSGPSWSPPARVAPDATRADCHPAVGAAADGTLVCAWDSRLLSSSGTSPEIRVATSSDGGTSWTAPVTVDGAPGFFAQRPRLSADPDGALRLVWYDARGTDWRWAVRSAVLTESGWRLDGDVLRGGSCTWPAVDRGVVVAATDRAASSQRHRRQEIALATVGADPTAAVPEVPLPVVLPLVAAGVTAVLARARRHQPLSSGSHPST
jgi:hypothetical protein